VTPDVRSLIREAAHRADEAVSQALAKYRSGGITDEEEITSTLVTRLDAKFEGRFGGLEWNTQILRHRTGKANEEGKIGADLVIHVALQAPGLKYSKAVLVQAKRLEPYAKLPKREQQRLVEQCDKMLEASAASYVFSYSRNEMRCDSATNVRGLAGAITPRNLQWTSYRFFLEFFRCSIGDAKITSADVRRLIAPNVVSISGSTDSIQIER
jgi:hypothetical protein